MQTCRRHLATFTCSLPSSIIYSLWSISSCMCGLFLKLRPYPPLATETVSYSVLATWVGLCLSSGRDGIHISAPNLSPDFLGETTKSSRSSWSRPMASECGGSNFIMEKWLFVRSPHPHKRGWHHHNSKPSLASLSVSHKSLAEKTELGFTEFWRYTGYRILWVSHSDKYLILCLFSQFQMSCLPCLQ